MWAGLFITCILAHLALLGTLHLSRAQGCSDLEGSRIYKKPVWRMWEQLLHMHHSIKINRLAPVYHPKKGTTKDRNDTWPLAFLGKGDANILNRRIQLEQIFSILATMALAPPPLDVAVHFNCMATCCTYTFISFNTVYMSIQSIAHASPYLEYQTRYISYAYT